MLRSLYLALTSLIFLGASVNAEDPPMDPQTKQFLEQINSQSFPPMDSIPLEELRKVIAGYAYPSQVQLASIKDINIPVENAEIPIRIYTPYGKGPFGVFVYFHGGGWVLGSLNQNDDLCRNIAKQAGIMVVSVDYRLAPEHKFPVPLHDCYDATLWISQNIQNYDGDPARIAIGGDSAGGNLAAAVSLMTKYMEAFTLKAQVLIYPVLSNRLDTSSFKKYGVGYNSNTADIKYFWNLYLKYPERGHYPKSSPLFAKDFTHLPPTLIISAHFDTLADDAIDYTQKLKEANVPVIFKDYPSIHVFVSMANQLDIGKQAVRDISDYLKTQLSQ